MIDIGKMIVSLRNERGWTQTDLAKRLKCSKQAVWMYEKNQRQPSYEMLEAMADVFNVPIGFLISEEDRSKAMSKQVGANYIAVDAIVSIPIVGTIRCGPGGLAYQDIEAYVPAANVKHPSECFYLRVVGDSMEPSITEGDLALIRKQDDVESGELAAVVINGEEGTLKRVIKKDGALILQAFNPAYPPRVFTGTDINTVRIAGKVIRTEKEW